MGKRLPLHLSDSVSSLSGVGPVAAKKLANLGIESIQDLLFHLPYRYIDRTHLTNIGSLKAGQEKLIQGQIELTQIQYSGRRSLLCRISDGTGAIILRLFHFSHYQQARLKKGSYLRCWGQVRRGSSSLEMIHPEYQHVKEDELEHVEQTLTPVYPLTEGIVQPRIRKLTDQALNVLDINPDGLDELLPADIDEAADFITLRDALVYLHRPPAGANLEQLSLGRHPSQLRLILEELLAHHLSLRLLRKQIRSSRAVPLNPSPDGLTCKMLNALPYTLTDAQQRVLNEIQQDLSQNEPMLRLIQGDVGSGKTILAAAAAVQSVESGLQAVLMVPTELLAEQHYRNLQNWLVNLDIPVYLLSGKLKASNKEFVISQMISKDPYIAVGTHALFQDDIKFGNLGLVIIDEQHRFGVHQRLSLIEKGNKRKRQPHQLIMTATPIPRTLAMTMFAELDISVLDELPPGRQPITTVVLSNLKRNEVIERISNVCKDGQQVYWVCTLIDDSDISQFQAAVKTYEYLSEMLPTLSIGLIHGRLKGPEKDSVMNDFKNGKLDLLVATTVIEVGVDVPNASLMVIENAERLGLAQLHQLRGRVGRGTEKSNCVLLYQPFLSELAQTRLEVMRSYNDGFVIAEKDLELRGPGDLMGTRQTGLPEMQIANIIRDVAYLPRMQKIADNFIKDHPQLVQKLIKRWLSASMAYGNV